MYHARLTSGGATATSGSTAAIGGQAGFDFDSDGADVAAGATAIATTFIQGMPLAVTGAILDAADAVVASATVTCAIK